MKKKTEGINIDNLKKLAKALLNKKKKTNAWEALGKLAGTFKDDTEYDEIMKENKKGWERWRKRLEKEIEADKEK